MKRILTLLLALTLLVSLAACSQPDETIAQLITANSTANLLETYDSVYIHGTTGGQLYVDYYLTQDISFETHENWCMYVTDDTAFSCQNGVYQKMVFLTSDGLCDYADYRASAYAQAILTEDSLLEKVTSFTEAGGQITLTSTMSRANLRKVMGQGVFKAFEATYVADAETHTLQTLKALFTLPDGSVVDLFTECSYNAEMPQELLDLQAYTLQTEDMRVITMVFHAGTAQEKVQQVFSPRGLPLGIGQPVGSNEELGFYADPACTEPYESHGDYTSDATIYIK